MKRLSILLLTAMLLLSLPGAAAAAPKSAQDSNEEELRTVIALLLIPAVQAAVDAFYAPYLYDTPAVDATFVSVESVTTNPGNTGYTVAVETEPYVGAHISVGRDRVTFKISVSGTVAVTHFEHLNSYPLPAHLAPLMKKPLP